VAEPDRDEVDESLAIARRVLAPSASNKQRVRASLTAPAVAEAQGRNSAASGLAAAAKLGAMQRLKAPLAVGALVGLGFLAGYWLGRHPELDPLALGVERVEPASVPSAAASEREAIEGEASAASAGGAAHVPSSALNDGDGRSAESAAGERSDGNSANGDRAMAERSGVQAPDTDRAANRASTTPANGVVRSRRASLGPRGTLLRPPARESSGDAFLEELALLTRIDRAIRADEALLASTLLAELAQRYPTSPLIEERAAARLLVDCALHEPTARARADRFVREHAASVYVERIRSSCALEVSSRLLPAKGRANADTDLREGGPHVQTP
jgi:hypothetical protein